MTDGRTSEQYESPKTEIAVFDGTDIITDSDTWDPKIESIH